MNPRQCRPPRRQIPNRRLPPLAREVANCPHLTLPLQGEARWGTHPVWVIRGRGGLSSGEGIGDVRVAFELLGDPADVVKGFRLWVAGILGRGPVISCQSMLLFQVKYRRH